MNCPDIARLNDYADGELATDDARAIEAHVAGCAHCRAAVDSLRALRAAAAGLEKEIAPPRDLWRGIAAQIETAPVAGERRGPDAAPASGAAGGGGFIPARPISRKVIQLFAPLAFAASIALLMILIERSSPLARRAGSGGWSVAAVEGAPRIGARSVAHADQLRVGEWLVTDANSRAKVAVAQIGEVNLERNSRLRLVGTSATDHRVELARGEISAFIYAPPRIFFVETPSATAVDLGCFYTLSVQDDGSGELHVTAGYVALESNQRESIVPAGWKCRTRKGAGPGTPFAADAPDALRSALERFDFTRIPTPAALDAVLAQVTAPDTVTLWHLLSRTEGAARARVFDTLARFQPPPAGVTRAGIIGGDDTMRRAWGEELGIGTFNVR